MIMSDRLCRLFVDRYFRGLIPGEHGEYLQRHYGNAREEWGIQPPMLSVWLKEDLDQFWDGEFGSDENEEKRKLRSNCLELAYGADEMYRDEYLKKDEVLAIYDILFWIYLSRTRPAKSYDDNREPDMPLPFEQE